MTTINGTYSTPAVLPTNSTAAASNLSLSQRIATTSALAGLTSVNSGTTTNGNSNGTPTNLTWYQALAGAWGDALDLQANQITDLANQVENGTNDPKTLTLLTAQSLEFSFAATSANTSISKAGDGLETIARK